jgi:nanoRNase/pAp phosphatase (c-di-AMP/oligoRNAs hydrolase)
MELQESKNIISGAKNIYLIPSEEPEAITSALALFYTLKDLGKNVNLLIDDLPENLKFLSPSLDFISYPKNFVISIPNNIARVSQIHYEKNDEALKIHLTLENGNIKKDNISFYYSEAKPDLIITIGIKDYQKELSDKLNSFGFLLDSPVVNIDTSAGSEQINNKFGKINLIENSSLAEIVFNLIDNLKKESATCLLAGLVIYTENFKNKLTANIFGIASGLMKNGADLKTITDNIKLN